MTFGGNTQPPKRKNPKPKAWVCPDCNRANYSHNATCQQCNRPRSQ